MITIEAGVLAKAMKNAAAVVESRNTIPILSNVRLLARTRDGVGQLTLTSTDMDVQFEQSLPATVDGELATTVDARRLSEIAGAVEAGSQVSLVIEAVAGAGGRLRVKSGRARWLLPILPPTDFPDLLLSAFDHAVTLPGKRLGEAWAKLGPAICTEVTRPYLGGILWHAEDGKSAGAATDGHRLMRVVLGEIDHPAAAPEVILARKFVRVTESLIKDLAEAVTLRWNHKLARLEAGDVVLTGKVIDGQFPDYRRVIPATVAQPVCLAPEAMTGALRRIRVASSDKTRSVKIERQADALLLSCSSPDSGAAEEQVPAECAAGFEAGFNVAYLQEILASIGGDSIEMHHDNPGAPALFRRVVPDGTLGVAMPMRV